MGNLGLPHVTVKTCVICGAKYFTANTSRKMKNWDKCGLCVLRISQGRDPHAPRSSVGREVLPPKWHHP